jgi:hypothetical protein
MILVKSFHINLDGWFVAVCLGAGFFDHRTKLARTTQKRSPLLEKLNPSFSFTEKIVRRKYNEYGKEYPQTNCMTI